LLKGRSPRRESYTDSTFDPDHHEITASWHEHVDMNRPLAALAAGLLLVPIACSRQDAKRQESPLAVVERGNDNPPPNAPVPATGPLRFVAIGGGPTPESTEVSLEQDIEIVQRALPPPGVVLFAGGSGSTNVRELEPAERGDSVMTALGDLFAPRSGRQSRYRAPRFNAERATLENVRARLSTAFADGGAPLIVYVAAHGDQGAQPVENTVALWGGRALRVGELAALHERHQRPLRLVATSCFSGGFAELAFAHADASTGRPSPVPRCGLFAGTADRETSGCDPNPNRRARESYGLYVVHALAGTRRDGSPLPLETADYDRDGKIGLLDAHTWARIEALSFDVPTTTSERWLRLVEPGLAAIDPDVLPEERAVVEHLGAALGLLSERAAQQRWAELDQKLEELDATIDRAEEMLSESVADEATLLLERWPVLDDPFHPQFEAMFRENRTAIESVLTSSPEARRRAEASGRTRALYEQLDRLSVDEARVFRLTRAYETLHKASALLSKGGSSALYYQSLLACERAPP
jgi:hypothetical protein